MIYFVHGPDRLLARGAVARIAAEVDPDGANTSRLDGRETSLERVITAIGSASFFGSPRVVIVSDLIGKSPRDLSPDSAPDGVETRPEKGPPLAPLLAAVPEENVLILHEPALAAAPASVRNATAQITIIAGEPPRGRELIAWIESAARESRSGIDRRAAQYLAESLFPQTWDRKPTNPRYDRPPDLALLTSEIEKLALAAYPEPIGVDHIRALVSGEPDQRLFRFVDAALAGELRSALSEWDRLRAAGEEPAMLLAQVLGQAELAAAAAASGGRDAATVARDLGSVTPGRMSAVISSARGRSPARTLAAVTSGVDTDRRLKTGRVRHPDGALHDLIVALATGASR